MERSAAPWRVLDDAAKPAEGGDGADETAPAAPWLTPRLIVVPHGLAARGIVWFRYGSNLPVTATQRNRSAAGSRRLIPDASECVRLIANSTRAWSAAF